MTISLVYKLMRDVNQLLMVMMNILTGTSAHLGLDPPPPIMTRDSTIPQTNLSPMIGQPKYILPYYCFLTVHLTTETAMGSQMNIQEDKRHEEYVRNINE